MIDKGLTGTFTGLEHDDAAAASVRIGGKPCQCCRIEPEAPVVRDGSHCAELAPLTTSVADLNNAPHFNLERGELFVPHLPGDREQLFLLRPTTQKCFFQ
jgi:hypothetical protein